MTIFIVEKSFFVLLANFKVILICQCICPHDRRTKKTMGVYGSRRKYIDVVQDASGKRIRTKKGPLI